jgi:regulator of cell morphogenesis and NO signaling
MLDLEQPLARLVLEHSAVAPVLQRHRLDFCCRGQVTLAVACAEKGLDTPAVAAELQAAAEARGARTANGIDPRTLPTAVLLDHIVRTHHGYLREVLPFLQTTSAKVARVHGEHNPRLRDLNTAVQTLCEILPPHLEQEETTLFPALQAETPDPEVLRAEFASMHTDHLAVGDLLHRVRAESQDFTLPDWACNSYRALFSELENLETDVLTHVHLENHVIMPRFVTAGV